MKASHSQLIKLAELGILKSLSDFLNAPLKPGKLRTQLMEIEYIADRTLEEMYSFDKNIFLQNKEEIKAYLEKFNYIMHRSIIKQEDIHITSIIGFCLSFLETTKSRYPKDLEKKLRSVLDYYTRQDNFVYVNFMTGRKFKDEWEKLFNG